MSDSLVDIIRRVLHLERRVNRLESLETPTIGGGGGVPGAPNDAQYVTLALDAGLTNERVLTEGADIDLVDTGANGTITVGRGGDTILLFDSGGTPVAEYAATAAGLAAAIAAWGAGYIITLPAIPIVGNIAIAGSCTIVGPNEFGAPTAGITGRVTITAGVVKLFSLYIQSTDATSILDITAATAYVNGCDVQNNGTGRVIYVHDAAAVVRCENLTAYQFGASALPCVEVLCSAGGDPALNDWDGQINIIANSTDYAVKVTGGTFFLKDARIANIGAGGDLQQTGGTFYIEDVQYAHNKTDGTLTPAQGDRSTWNVSTTDTYHASDIYAALLTRHVPLPGADGGTIVSSGGGWVRVPASAIPIAIGAWERYAANPILTLGGGGAWDDTDVLNPSIVKISDTEYHMLYSGYNGAGNWQTGHATSADGITWVKDAGNPVIAFGIGWEALSATNGTTVLFGGTWYHYYCGEDVGNVWKVGVATSASINGPWVKNPGNPILTAAGGWEGANLGDVFAFVLDSRIYMFYVGASPQQIGLMWSDDGINFTRYASNPVLAVGAAGTWDDAGVAEPSITRVGQYFYMWYTGSDGADRQIGMAYSTDLITWTKYVGNPVLSGNAGWDAGDVCDQEIILENGQLVMFYGGGTIHNPLSINGQIGRATVVFPNVYISIDTGTGLTGGPIHDVGEIVMADTLVTPGTYTNTTLTVDQQGRLTAASSGTGAYTELLIDDDMNILFDDDGDILYA